MGSITLTETASTQALELLSKESEPKIGLRIAVKGGGCSGNRYEIGWSDPKEQDEIYTCSNGLVVMVDQKSMALLDGSTLEFYDSIDIEKQGFEVLNPNSCGTCGCGKSFSS